MNTMLNGCSTTMLRLFSPVQQSSELAPIAGSERGRRLAGRATPPLTSRRRCARPPASDTAAGLRSTAAFPVNYPDNLGASIHCSPATDATQQLLVENGADPAGGRGCTGSL
jgi:hypothetical protein